MASGTAGGSVRLDYAPRGGAWRRVTETRAGAGGTYRFSLRPQRSGSFRAVSAEGISAARVSPCWRAWEDGPAGTCTPARP